MSDVQSSEDGFVAFFRRYTKTWVHAVATAGLTAFGLLTFVNRWFVALALASYLVPPVVLYLVHGGDAADIVEGQRDAGQTTDESEPERRVDQIEAGSGSDEAGSRPVEPAENDTDRADEDAQPIHDGDQRAGEDAQPNRGDAEPDRQWKRTNGPTDLDLRDAALTDGGACAVGDGGVVLAERGGEWTVALAEGPAAQGEDLVGVDATADGAAVWVAGDSGALGRLDADDWQHVDYTAPDGITDNWSGVAVGGPAGEETILLINGSGEVLCGEFGDDGPSWASPVTPGSGSSLSGVELVDTTLAYCCDTNDGVFETTDAGQSFAAVGLDGADGTPTDIAATDRDDCVVADDDGVVHRYNGRAWTPDRLFDDELTGIARDGEDAVACGEDGVFERSTQDADWERHTFEDDAFQGVDVRGERAVVVGEDGVVVSR
ncbi:hypothetical protein SAMN06269185_0659 [Natronoarchaeum philippinense]|uniref:Uncharacterized protein n=1 Tax=Natronoarchaeum philippinense TaxID=558529 RepID=A0A285N5P0_NATPI|nr:hypothetical protein [Natronoarchaeum philippinense]SNZ04730.1 hypothetical protein SAMN06269185_0659 [Natronoarchaeum philippinense]